MPTKNKQKKKFPKDPTKTMSDNAGMVPHQVLGQIYQGPIPTPDVLKKYNVLLPGAADRILSMAEQEAAHRHKMEERALEIEFEDLKARARDSRWGQIFGFLIGFFTVVAGTYTVTLGYQWPGGFIGTSGVLGLVSVFVIGRKR